MEHLHMSVTGERVLLRSGKSQRAIAHLRRKRKSCILSILGYGKNEIHLVSTGYTETISYVLKLLGYKMRTILCGC
jgi:hypothetical protein